MNFFGMIIVAVVGLMALVSAVPTTNELVNTISFDNGNVTTNYTLVDIEWNVLMNNSATPYNMTVVGSIQEVFAQINASDPAAGAVIHARINATLNATLNANLNETDSDLQTREYDPTDWDCNVDRSKNGRANVYYIYEGMKYLDNVPGSPKNGPGPGACGRVSCSYDSAIFWCNDNNVEYILDSFSDIADGAQLVVSHCRVGGGIWGLVNGQQFYSDNWNVLLNGNKC